MDKIEARLTMTWKFENGYKCIEKMDGYAMFAYLKLIKSFVYHIRNFLEVRNFLLVFFFIETL